MFIMTLQFCSLSVILCTEMERTETRQNKLLLNYIINFKYKQTFIAQYHVLKTVIYKLKNGNDQKNCQSFKYSYNAMQIVQKVSIAIYILCLYTLCLFAHLWKSLCYDNTTVYTESSLRDQPPKHSGGNVSGLNHHCCQLQSRNAVNFICNVKHASN